MANGSQNPWRCYPISTLVFPRVVESHRVSDGQPSPFDTSNRLLQTVQHLSLFPATRRFLEILVHLVMPGCMLRRILCHSSRMNFFTSTSSGTHTLPWNLNMPSLPKVNSLTSSDPSYSLTLFKLASNNCLSLIESKKSLDIVRVLHLMNSDPNSTYNFISLNFSNSSTSLIMRYAVCTVFLHKASATTFVFPGWYNSSKS